MNQNEVQKNLTDIRQIEKELRQLKVDAFDSAVKAIFDKLDPSAYEKAKEYMKKKST